MPCGPTFFTPYAPCIAAPALLYNPSIPFAPQPKVQLTGTAISTDASGRTLFRTARVGDLDLALGQVVALNGEEEEEAAQPALGMVLALFKDADGEMQAQVRGEEGPGLAGVRMRANHPSPICLCLNLPHTAICPHTPPLSSLPPLSAAHHAACHRDCAGRCGR